MKTKGILISSAIGLLAVTAVAATTLSLGTAAGSEGAMMGGHGAMFGGHRGGHRGGRGMAHLCGAVRGEKVEHAISFVETFMTFTAPQQQAWDELAQAVRSGNDRVEEACAELKDGEMPQSATAKLAMVETLMGAGLEVVSTLRPAFDKFYGTLNEKQQQALDDLFSRRHRG